MIIRDTSRSIGVNIMKILYVASIGGFFPFFKDLTRRLLDEGHIVDFAANFSEWQLPPYYKEWGCKGYDLPIERNPIKRSNISVAKRIMSIVEDNGYDIVHCHTPVASICTRLGCRGLRKKGLKVIYTAHGFHFYDGAPLKNWLIFYPIEKHFSRYTDVLITINKEDYKRASEKFHAKKTVYIPGVGVDTEKFKPRESGRERIRSELGLKDGQILLLSVGELNENKNHVSVIRAIAGLDLVYVIVGKGEKKDELERVAREKGVDVRLVGFRNDVADFYDAADIYILPSIREGLNVSLMEAMASSLPCLAGNIRGNVDLIDEKGGYLFIPENEAEIRTAVEKCIENRDGMGKYNLQKIRGFNKETVTKRTTEIYRSIG